MEKIKLFCLPYAGGSALVYKEWKKYLHNSIELHAIELAGRGTRFGTPFYGSIDEAVSDIYNEVSKDLDSCPYAILGHSMGSVLAYELAYKLKSLRHSSPLHLFFSGRRPPHIAKHDKNFHLLPDQEFMDEIMKLGGTPEELLRDKELMEFYMPVLRSDFKIIETYRYVEKNEKLDCDITVFWGKQEVGTTVIEISEWRSHTDKNCRIEMFNGGHFFINKFVRDVVKCVDATLLSANCFADNTLYKNKDSALNVRRSIKYFP